MNEKLQVTVTFCGVLAAVLCSTHLLAKVQMQMQKVRGSLFPIWHEIIILAQSFPNLQDRDEPIVMYESHKLGIIGHH